MVASRGAERALVFGPVAVIVVATLALSPVSSDRARRGGPLQDDHQPRGRPSATDRSAHVLDSCCPRRSAPLGHGLGTAGEASKLSGNTALRAPDNGYLALMYQVGPIGFLLVLAALGSC